MYLSKVNSDTSSSRGNCEEAALTATERKLSFPFFQSTSMYDNRLTSQLCLSQHCPFRHIKKPKNGAMSTTAERAKKNKCTFNHLTFQEIAKMHIQCGKEEKRWNWRLHLVYVALVTSF